MLKKWRNKKKLLDFGAHLFIMINWRAQLLQSNAARRSNDLMFIARYKKCNPNCY